MNWQRLNKIRENLRHPALGGSIEAVYGHVHLDASGRVWATYQAAQIAPGSPELAELLPDADVAVMLRPEGAWLTVPVNGTGIPALVRRLRFVVGGPSHDPQDVAKIDTAMKQAGWSPASPVEAYSPPWHTSIERMVIQGENVGSFRAVWADRQQLIRLALAAGGTVKISGRIDSQDGSFVDQHAAALIPRRARPDLDLELFATGLGTVRLTLKALTDVGACGPAPLELPEHRSINAYSDMHSAVVTHE